ncbi:MAG: pseudouridine synthase [Candidatus Eisenbacteria bacterium]|nr:pseudouridine synthase [Candidatus Eisenbacteria bacterium]
MEGCRLNRFLASRGVASRRACDDIIRAGRVCVNGTGVLSPGTNVTPGEDVIEVDGRAVAEKPEPIYVMLNKPAGVIVTAKDTRRRKAVTELVPDSLGRLFPVGRLDLDTEGLLLLTNDGDLAFRLTHPSFGVEKVYEVLVRERPAERALTVLGEGVDFGEGLRSSPAKVRYVGGQERGHLIRLTICEGKKRQVRRMCRAVGLTVLSLRRTALGPLELGSMPGGSWRELTGSELEALKACAREKPEGAGRSSR